MVAKRSGRKQPKRDSSQTAQKKKETPRAIMKHQPQKKSKPSNQVGQKDTPVQTVQPTTVADRRAVSASTVLKRQRPQSPEGHAQVLPLNEAKSPVLGLACNGCLRRFASVKSKDAHEARCIGAMFPPEERQDDSDKEESLPEENVSPPHDRPRGVEDILSLLAEGGGISSEVVQRTKISAHLLRMIGTKEAPCMGERLRAAVVGGPLADGVDVRAIASVVEHCTPVQRDLLRSMASSPQVASKWSVHTRQLMYEVLAELAMAMLLATRQYSPVDFAHAPDRVGAELDVQRAAKALGLFEKSAQTVPGSKKDRQEKTQRRCFKCNRLGHVQADCRKK